MVQGKEPAHFRQLFRGNLVVHAGGKASGFKNRNEGDSYDTDGIALFLIKGTDALNTSAKQVCELADIELLSLNLLTWLLFVVHRLRRRPVL